MFAKSTSFSKKAGSSSKVASLLWYFKDDLNLLRLFGRYVGLTSECTVVKVSENVKENEPLSQARVSMTKTKNKTLVECVYKNNRKLLFLNDRIGILHRAAS